MKTIHAIRHAKASWDHPSLQGDDKPLSARGIREAHGLQQPLQSWVKGKVQVSCSPDNASVHTAVIAAKHLGLSPDLIDINDQLLLPNREKLMAMIQGIQIDVDSLVIVMGCLPECFNAILAQSLPFLEPGAAVSLRFKGKTWSDFSGQADVVAAHHPPIQALG